MFNLNIEMIITHYFHDVYGFENRLWDNIGRGYERFIPWKGMYVMKFNTQSQGVVSVLNRIKHKPWKE